MVTSTENTMRLGECDCLQVYLDSGRRAVQCWQKGYAEPKGYAALVALSETIGRTAA
jgi:hypothetical protein